MYLATFHHCKPWLWYSLFNSEDNRNTIPPCIKLKSKPTYLISSWPLQAGEENPVVHLSVVSLNGPLHTVLMKKPDDPRIGWVTAWVFLIVCEALKIALQHCLKMRWRLWVVLMYCQRLFFLGGTIISPWWNGPPAPNWLSTGWTEPRTTLSWHCVRLRLESALRWN